MVILSVNNSINYKGGWIMKTIQSYSDFTLNSTIVFQGDNYRVLSVRTLTRGLKQYKLERI